MILSWLNRFSSVKSAANGESPEPKRGHRGNAPRIAVMRGSGVERGSGERLQFVRQAFQRPQQQPRSRQDRRRDAIRLEDCCRPAARVLRRQRSSLRHANGGSICRRLRRALPSCPRESPRAETAQAEPGRWQTTPSPAAAAVSGEAWFRARRSYYAKSRTVPLNCKSSTGIGTDSHWDAPDQAPSVPIRDLLDVRAKPLEHRSIGDIRLVFRCLDDLGDSGEARVVHDPPESPLPNHSFANELMPVTLRAKRSL